MSRPAGDPVLLEVLRCQLQGVVEQMGELLMRCGHTVFVKETQDFVVALLTPAGEAAVCSRRVGIWIAVGQNFRAVLEAGGPYRPGDVWFTNDPEESRGLVTHLPDTFCWRPVFVQGELVCFAAAFIHCTDLGGIAPGSVAPRAVDQFQEGLVVPVTRLVEEDRIREDILRIFRRNSRIPDHNRGDLLALLAALRLAESRLHQLAEKFGGQTLRAGLDSLLDHAEAQARSIIAAIPDGEYTFWDYLEGDLIPGNRPVRIRLTLRVQGSDLELDFAGTDPQVAAAFNVPTYGTDGHYLLVMALVNYMRTVQPDLLYNSGLVRPVRLRVPRGSLLNPEPFAPCGARQATFFRVADVVLGALAQALPQRMPAAGCGQGSIMLVSTPDLERGEQHVSIVQPLVGGSGARPLQDGTDGVDFTTGFYRNIPTEILEAEVPVRVEAYALRPDSGGPGLTRGGMGLRYVLRVLVPGTVVTARGLERFRFQPWGREGGLPGAGGRAILEEPGGRSSPLGKIDVLEVPPGAALVVETAGGGGFGPPWERPAELVLRDVEDGLVSPEQAEECYGVVVREGRVDEGATLARRRLMREHGGPSARFAFGEAREAFERLWPDELQLALNDATSSWPVPIRQYIRAAVAKDAEAHREGGDAVSPEWIARRVAEVAEELRGTVRGVPGQSG